MPEALHPYPSPEERDRQLVRQIERAQGELVTYGRSVQGRPLLAARVPQSSAPKPHARVLCTANIHGVEYVSSQVATGLLAALTIYEPLRRLRERAEIWVIPCLNPDGYARTWEAGGRGSLRDLRTNARGVDLNRNFPLPPNQRRRPWPGAGSPREGTRTFRGPHPLSEPETEALASLLADKPFRAGTNGHSFMGRVIPAHVVERAESRAYADLCRAFGQGQPRFSYRRLASRFFDTFTGELEDFQHHVHHTWSICVETMPVFESIRQHLRAPSLFWRFNPHEPGAWVDNDVPGIAAFLNAALDLPSSPRGCGTGS
jgi:hypothetical protein